MKGIILAGGAGSRLYPLTIACNKQLLPIYDKPMVYYPLSTLINLKIKDICIISDNHYIGLYKNLFGDGSHLGLNLTYIIQPKPEGLPQAFILAEEFIQNDNVVLILGDNVFHGLSNIDFGDSHATIFAYKVNDPREYGVVEFEGNKIISIEEKPIKPKSKYAVPGLYYFNNDVIGRAGSLRPSKRGELEITELINTYWYEGKLNAIKMSKGTVWLDAGSPQTLFQSAAYIQTIQDRQGYKVACIEEDCFNQGFINKEELDNLIKRLPKSEYREYLVKLE